MAVSGLRAFATHVFWNSTGLGVLCFAELHQKRKEITEPFPASERPGRKNFMEESGAYSRAARFCAEPIGNSEDYKRAEQRMRETQARFEGVIDSAMDAIISIDETQRVVLF